MKWPLSVHATLWCGIVSAVLSMAIAPRGVAGIIGAALAAFVVGRQTMLDAITKGKRDE